MTDSPDLNRDLERLAHQETVLQFAHFDGATAWSLGCRLKELAEARSAALTIEVRLGGHPVFFHAMPGTSPANEDWARRKHNSVELLHRSSYRIGRELEREGTTLEAKLGLPLRDHASHGGCFPLMLRGTGVIGVVTVSGLPQRDDHALVVQALAELCGVAPESVALD